MVRPQELCESRGGRPGLPVPNNPYGLCGRKATLNLTLERSSRNPSVSENYRVRRALDSLGRTATSNAADLTKSIHEWRNPLHLKVSGSRSVSERTYSDPYTRTGQHREVRS